ncbi:TonB-dependent siderophore receptor [Nostoc sp. PCC 7524]|uniref:TonB-dependent siderophore receptor n=1 Tax=Nostoc sp. (strain ATCC 29411 / PCC 7524) TaxID=28072 RepID=UPI00029EE69C|nr:TonB-dependent siderophore receptor [Nostoc sp. PCC 7524]AFY51247.1 TonB-dependent siderophore receptor [Nostoc sp. PCC 7524]
MKKFSLFCLISSSALFVFQESVKAQAQVTSTSQVSNVEIPHVNELATVVTTSTPLLAQVLKVTGVKIDSTTTGIELVLETSTGILPEPITTTENNTLIIDIPNTVLTLSDGNEFRRENPAPGIKLVSITQNDANNIRVSITGETSVPTAQIISSDNGLILSVIPSENQPDIELTVTGNPNTATVNKTDTPLQDLPFSVQVFPQQLIQDQRALNVGEAVRNISGFALSGRGGGRNESSLVTRGFTADQFRDGFSEGNNANRVFTEVSNLERIEVLKGPTATLYGQSEPGGIVNLVTKRPLAKPYYQAEYIGGSFGFNRGNLDFTGPLDSNRNAKYRLNLAYENTDSFREGVETERFFIAPKLTFNLSSQTTLSVFGEYLEDSRPVDFGLVAVGNSVADIPISRFLGDPTRKNDVYQRRAYIFLDHNFSDNWSISSAFRTTSSDQDFSAIFGRGNALQFNNQVLPLQAQNNDLSFNTNTWQTNLVGKFNTGSIKHTALIGFEWGNERRTTVVENANAGSINIFRPVYRFSVGRFNTIRNQDEETNLFGIYLQNEIAVTDNLKLLLGGRFDTVDFDLQDNLNNIKSSTYSDAFSPRIGIVYQPSKPISLYANFSRSFVSQSGSSFDGTPFQPERGTQYEIGVKADWFSGRLSSTLAFYQITKTNVLVTDPNRPTFFIQTGEQRSRGVELDLVGEILPGWNVITSYAYTDAIITNDTIFPEGNRLANVPRNALSFWTTYTIPQGDLQGLGFGTGVFFADARSGDLNNSFTLPSYRRVDASIYYNYRNFRAALNIKNLFDTRYFESAQSRTAIFPGAPLTILGTISLQF